MKYYFKIIDRAQHKLLKTQKFSVDFFIFTLSVIKLRLKLRSIKKSCGSSLGCSEQETSFLTRCVCLTRARYSRDQEKLRIFDDHFLDFGNFFSFSFFDSIRDHNLILNQEKNQKKILILINYIGKKTQLLSEKLLVEKVLKTD